MWPLLNTSPNARLIPHTRTSTHFAKTHLLAYVMTSSLGACLNTRWSLSGLAACIECVSGYHEIPTYEINFPGCIWLLRPVLYGVFWFVLSVGWEASWTVWARREMWGPERGAGPSSTCPRLAPQPGGGSVFEGDLQRGAQKLGGNKWRPRGGWRSKLKVSNRKRSQWWRPGGKVGQWPFSRTTLFHCLPWRAFWGLSEMSPSRARLCLARSCRFLKAVADTV